MSHYFYITPNEYAVAATQKLMTKSEAGKKAQKLLRIGTVVSMN